MYAACADRRVLQLGPQGQITQQLRLGSAHCELQAPLRLSMDGRLLTVGLTGPDMGVGLMETLPVLRPVARLVGHAEASQGIAFLGNTVLSCSLDGAMLLWRSPASEDLDGRNFKTPRPPKLPQNADGILRRLLASSPKPPRWASTRDVRDGPGFAEKAESENMKWIVSNAASTSNGVWDEEGEIGKWGRISKVGAQVRSASDLHQLVREEASMLSSIMAKAPAKSCVELPFVNADSSNEPEPQTVEAIVNADLSNEAEFQTVEAVVKDSSVEAGAKDSSKKEQSLEAGTKDSSKKEQSILEAALLLEEESTDAESAGLATYRSNPGSNSESEASAKCTASAPPSFGNLGLQPLRRLLPPVPNFPPPGVEAIQAHRVSKELRPTPKPVGENAPLVSAGDHHVLCSVRRESAASKSSTCSGAEPAARARSLFQDLSQEPTAVLMELTYLLQEKMEPAEEPSPLPTHCASVKKAAGSCKEAL